MHSTTSRQSYYLYHHQPDPLPPEAMDQWAWLLNNGVTYSVVATIQARSAEEAYHALRAHMAGTHQRVRAVELRPGNLLRETLPGDVLVGMHEAWMILPADTLQSIPYETSQPWKKYLHQRTVTSLCWSPDGHHVVAGDYDDVHIHTLTEGEELSSTASYRHHANRSVQAVAWSPDGSRIASGGYDGEVHVWKPAPFGGHGGAAVGSIIVCRTEEQERWHASDITCLAWRPDSHSLLAGRRDGAVVWWETHAGECLLISKRHERAVTALISSPDGSRIASTGADGMLRIWQDVPDPDQDVICQHADEISSCAWSPDATLLVSACAEDQSLQFWDPVSGASGERIPLSVSTTRQPNIRTLDWSPDGRFIAAGCEDGTLQVVDLVSRRHILTYRLDATYHVSVVAWSPNGRSLASAGSGGSYNGGHVQIWPVGRDVEDIACQKGHPEEGEP
jgi:hypothetical protein